MEARRLRAGVVLLLAVAALGAAGAAVDSSGGGSGSSGSGGGASSGSGSEGGTGIVSELTEGEPLFPGDLLTMLLGAMAVAGFVAAVVAVALALLRWDWAELLAYARSKAGKVAMVLFGLVSLYALFQLLDFSGGNGSARGFRGRTEGLSDTASETGVELSAAVGIAIVVVVLVVMLLVARSVDGDDEEGGAPPVAPDPDDAAVGSGGSRFGGAEVGRVPADNEVYEAWLSLADAANANAREDTPGEVADRAVDAGVDEEAAREITSLFESVRYGGREPTSSLEQRAERARAKLSGER